MDKRSLTITPKEPIPPEPLRTAEWVHEHLLGGGEDIDVAWVRKHVPCVRLSRKVKRYKESMVRAWLSEREKK